MHIIIATPACLKIVFVQVLRSAFPLKLLAVCRRAAAATSTAPRPPHRVLQPPAAASTATTLTGGRG